MATIIAYRRLVEVRLLHEYYLISPQQPGFYDMTTAQLRLDALKNSIRRNRYRLSQDLQIEPTEATQAVLAGLGWRFVPTLTGFVLAVPTKTVQQGASTVVKPKIEPFPNTQLYFQVSARNRLFNNFTALPLRKPDLPAIHYFTNRPEAVHFTNPNDSNDTFFTLSLPHAAFDQTQNYEMGEVADHGGGQLKEYTAHADPNETWRAIGGIGFVNANDRIALPKTFRYPLDPALNITQATFTLRTPAGDFLKEISVQSANALSGALLDFSSIPNPAGGPGAEIGLRDGAYELTVDAGSVQTVRPVFLSDHYRLRDLGLIHLNLDQTDNNYRLLNPDHSIRNLNPDLTGKPQHPVFEIRLRSRITYWRYKPEYTDKDLLSDTAGFVQPEAPNLVSLFAQPMSYLHIGLRDGTNIEPQYPQPPPSPIKQEKTGRFFSEYSTRPIPGLIKYN